MCFVYIMLRVGQREKTNVIDKPIKPLSAMLVTI